jgi:hypothetical protein
MRIRICALAGAAGGAAEVLWIAGVAPAQAQDVALAVGATFHPGLPASIGVAIHMVLSIALGLALAKVLLGVARGSLVPAALAALAGVWTINFFVVLPLVNPGFVTLLPLGVTLVSKLLFGAAAGLTLVLAHERG